LNFLAARLLVLSSLSLALNSIRLVRVNHLSTVSSVQMFLRKSALAFKSVTFSISSNKSNSDTVCSKEEEIRGPILLTKVDKNLREILTKLMPGESYNFSKNNGSTRRVTLCERFINEKQNKVLSFENIKKNEEALRLSNALMLELRRNTTIVKK